MEMASVELGGFEVRTDTKSVYVTDNFFSMLGMERDLDEILDADSFVKIVKNFESECSYTTGSDNAKVYCVKYDDGDIRYVRMEINKEMSRCIGLVEDVTKVTRERMNIEYEKKLGNNIRQLRTHRQLTQEQLSARLQIIGIDITRSALAKIEVGQRHIYPDEIKGICDILEISYEQIFPDDSN